MRSCSSAIRLTYDYSIYTTSSSCRYFDFYARSPTYLVHFLHCAQHGNPLHPRWASEMAQLDRHTVAQFCLTDDRLLGAGVGTGGEVMLRAAMPGLLGFLWSMNSDVQLRSWVDDFFQYGRGRLGHYDSYRVAKETCVASMGKGYRCTRTFYSYDLVHSTPWGPKRGAYNTPKHVLYACIA